MGVMTNIVDALGRAGIDEKDEILLQLEEDSTI
jgi:hypothetical protein